MNMPMRRTSKPAPRLTIAVRRGLDTIASLAEADVEADAKRWSKQQHDELSRAFDYMRYLTVVRPNKRRPKVTA